jgi:alcohol dehydrogenase, propanol-preferring
MTKRMNAWLLQQVTDLSRGADPLQLAEVPCPKPHGHELLLRISCCGVCHTELDEIEGRSPPPRYPLIPGHQVIGRLEERGAQASRFAVGERLGVAWIFSACGQCSYCRSGLENLCPAFVATGRDAHGGYAEYMLVDEQFAYRIPEIFTDTEAAPLLCAGAIGYRALRLCELQNGQCLGLCGFGASGHLVLKMARHLYPASPVVVFARSREEQEFALQLGAAWAGAVTQTPDYLPDAIIDTTPVWAPLLEALRQLKPGGRMVINAIRKEVHDQQALLQLSYQHHLWMEKEIKTVANLTRADVEEFLALAAAIPLKPVIDPYPFLQANRALLDLKHKHVQGAKVLVMD